MLLVLIPIKEDPCKRWHAKEAPFATIVSTKDILGMNVRGYIHRSAIIGRKGDITTW